MNETFRDTLDEYRREDQVSYGSIPSAMIVDDTDRDDELERLHEELEYAARCVDRLEEMGARITVCVDAPSGGLDIQVRTDSGRLLSRLEARTLIDLVGFDRTELAAWLALLHHRGSADPR